MRVTEKIDWSMGWWAGPQREWAGPPRRRGLCSSVGDRGWTGGASAEKEGARGRGLRGGRGFSGRGPQEEGRGLHVGGVWSWHPRPPLQAPAASASPPAPHLSPPRRPRMWRTPAWTRHPTWRLAPPRIPGSPARAPHRAHLAIGRRPPSRGGHGPCQRRTRHSPSPHPRVPGGWRLWLEEVSPGVRVIRALGGEDWAPTVARA